MNIRTNICLPLIAAASFIMLNVADAQIIPLTVVNGDFETDANGTPGATGWTIATDHFWTSDGSVGGALDPDSGANGTAKFLSPNRTVGSAGSNPESSFAEQSIDLSAWATEIDTGAVRLGVGFYYSNGNFPEERSVVSVEFFDGSAGSLGVVTSGDLPATGSGTWSAVNLAGGAIAVPSGARSFVITLNQRRVIDGIIYGTATNAGIDEVTAALAVSPGTPGFDFFVDASQDDGVNQVWEDLTPLNPTGQDLFLDDSPAVNHVAVAGSLTSFTDAYDFPGGSIGNEAGALVGETGTGTPEGFINSDNGPWNLSPVTMEIWFKPDSLTDTATNGQILFEDGGGTGLGLFLNDNILYVSNDSGIDQISYDIGADPDGLLLAAATSDFIQVVITADTAAPNEVILYINGQAVGSSNNDGNWTGGDDAAFGTRGGANTGGLGGSQSDSESFNGQIALIRAYYDEILDLSEIQTNFLAYAPDILPPVITDLSPADDSFSVTPATLTATFNEDIALTGVGIVTITDTDDGSGTQVFNLPDGDVTVTGNELIITPAIALEPDTNYEVTITDTVIEDVLGNTFDGVAAGEWNFTADGTPPTLDTFENNKPGGQIYDNDSVTYTVTFDEDMNAGTIETGDFSALGTAGGTVDSVTPISDSVYEVVVTPTSTGTIQLQVNASANLEDLATNELDTTSAILDAAIIDVLTIVANSGSIALDFQETVASEEFDAEDNTWGDTAPGRYWHISVNPNNAGYAAYIALDSSGNVIPPYIRSFSNPVVGWSFIGGGPDNVLTISEESGGLVSWTTTDTVFDAFGMNQKKFWNATDPGAGFNLPVDETAEGLTTHDKQIAGYRAFGQATATIDVSSLASGKVIFFYGAFGATPQVDAILRDSSGLEPDIVLADLHTNGDAAQRTEYYAAEVSFDTDGGIYDTIVHNYFQGGNGNGRSGGLVVTGVVSATTPYADWASLNSVVGGFGGNDDNGSTSNGFEWYYFGTDPQVVNGNSSPLTGMTKTGANTFEFTHQRPIVRGDVTDDYEWSADLSTWTANGVAEGGITVDIVAVGDASGPTYETVTVTATISGGTLDELFVRQVLVLP